MKSKILISGFLLASAVFFSASASATTLALDGLVLNQDTPYIEQGYSLFAPGEHLHRIADPVVLVFAAEMANDTAGMVLTKVGGGAFSFESLFKVALAGTGLHVDGLLGGSLVAGASTILANGTQSTENFLANNAAWGNVDEVQFWFDDAGGFGNPGDGSIAASFDNFRLRDIVVNAAVVPVPAAVWLFLSALGGLGAMRRKQAIA